MNVNEAFGRIVVKLRKERGLSQESFAWDIGSDRKYMSDVELGKRKISLLFADKVAKGFGITLIELFNQLESEMYGSKNQNQQ